MYVDTGNRLSLVVDSQGLGPIRPVMQLSFPCGGRAAPPSPVRRAGRRTWAPDLPVSAYFSRMV